MEHRGLHVHDGGRPFGVQVFGHTTVRTPDRILRASDFAGVKPRHILELIALGRGEPVRKAAIAEHIWSGRPPRRWQATLESYVAVLRRAMQPGVPGRATVLCTTPGGYRLDTERVAVDLHDFDVLARRATHAAPRDALPLWERAVELADDVLLATEPYAGWAADARRTHERTLHAAAVTGAEIALALQAPERAVRLARRATALDPLAEHGWQLLSAPSWPPAAAPRPPTPSTPAVPACAATSAWNPTCGPASCSRACCPGTRCDPERHCSVTGSNLIHDVSLVEEAP